MHCKVLLFDGESSLKSKVSQKRVRDRFNIQIKAEPGFKRYSAERYVKEVKLRSALALELEGGQSLYSVNYLHPPFTPSTLLLKLHVACFSNIFLTKKRKKMAC